MACIIALLYKGDCRLKKFSKKTLGMLVVMLLVGFGIGFGVNWFVLQKENKVEQEAIKYTRMYMKEQGIDSKDVTLFEVQSDAKQEGYVVLVETKKDPDVRYEYMYTDFTKKRKEHLLVTALSKDDAAVVTPKYKVSE